MTARSEQGSVSLELVLLAPVLLAVMLLVVAFGRHSNTQGYVDQAARDAARSATSTRDFATAKVAVQRTIEADLATAPHSCSDSATHQVATSNGDLFVASSPFEPGALNVLTVTVECDVDVSDLAFIGFGQTMHLSSTFSSPIPAIYGTY
ncbi:MAG: TadE/TadG family type IV pilus assembly protein [Nocardioidaceae bacterium]